jgi:multidrug efflux system outer membrane protein
MKRSLSLLLLVAACAASAPPDRPDLPELAASWASASTDGAVVSGPWWTSMDPTLDGLVEEALANNRDLQASAARLRAAVALADGSRAGRRPTLDALVNAQRRERNFIGFPIPGQADQVLSTTTTTHDAGLRVSWELDLWDRLGASERAALAESDAASADLAAARQSIAAATARGWFFALEAGLQEDLARRTLAAWEGTEGVVSERYAAGLTIALDLRLARANTASARAALAAAVQVHGEARRQLELVLGRYPAGAQTANGALVGDLPPAPAGVPVELLGRRPDLVAARARFEAARERSGAARADLWPRLTLTGDAGRSSGALEDLLEGDYSVWGLAARLAAPIYDGGRRRAAIEGADAVCEQAAAALASSVLIAASEVERALAAEAQLRDRALHLSSAQTETSEASILALDRYAAGLVGVITLLETQRGQLRAESQHLAARRDLVVSRIDLHLALGGGFDE